MGEEIQFKAYEQQQGQLFPGHLRDALDPSDPVFFIDDAVESLDVSGFEEHYAVMGERAYPPRMLLKLWLFGATAGVYSGRELARRVQWDLRFRYLAGSLRPDFRTINRFRTRHRKEFSEIFRQTVQMARAAGLGKLGMVGIDGTKVRANTSRHKAMSHGRMLDEEARLADEIAQILAQMDAVEAAEDREHGEDGDGSGGLPQELQNREKRLEKLRAVRAQLEAEKGSKLAPKHQKSFADPDAQMMKSGDGSLQYAYNAQAAVSEDGIIVATGLTSEGNDQGQLVPMVEAVKAVTGKKPQTAVADAGYRSEAGLKTLRRRRQRCLVALGRERKRAVKWPRGKYSRRMARMLRLPWARALYALRKTVAERPFAEIKATMGFRRFSLRGRAKVRGEWDLVCAAFNLKRLRAATEAA